MRKRERKRGRDNRPLLNDQFKAEKRIYCTILRERINQKQMIKLFFSFHLLAAPSSTSPFLFFDICVLVLAFFLFIGPKGVAHSLVRTSLFKHVRTNFIENVRYRNNIYVKMSASLMIKCASKYVIFFDDLKVHPVINNDGGRN